MRQSTYKGRSDVDRILGGLVRSRRMTMQMSQTVLGDKLGVTFRQVQKYEQGLNRISCATLYRCAEALDVPMIYFFQHFPKAHNVRSNGVDSNTEAIAFLATKEGHRLMAAMSKLPAAVRRDMTTHIHTVADALSVNRKARSAGNETSFGE
jgi:transcriptional regulator with XRE-family HTH domain